jgi:hypothetical protein
MDQLLDEGREEANRITDRLSADDGTGAIAAERGFKRRLCRSEEFMQVIALHVHEAPAA